MNEKLKTLKDFENEAHSFNSDEMELNAYLINPVELKAEAVKWVKEDYSIIEMIRDGLVVNADYFTKRWMIRLDLTEEDLKWKFVTYVERRLRGFFQLKSYLNVI